jgi:hypothetical protein
MTCFGSSLAREIGLDAALASAGRSEYNARLYRESIVVAATLFEK